LSGLAAGLIGLAAWFADRAARGSRRASALHQFRTSPTRAQSRSVMHPVTWIAAGGLVGWVIGGAPGAVVGAVAVGMAWRMRRRRHEGRELSALHEQLADAVRTIVSGLRSGLSIPQALAYASRESQPPLAGELATLVLAIDSGVPFDEAVDAWAMRTGGDDPRLIASVLKLHRRTGGDLPMVLDHVADTLRERLAVRREVRALTAQARLSGVILGALPVAFFGILWVTSRSDIEAALSSTAGLLSISIGLVLEAGAFIWIRHLLEVR
jgi:tight adherence protein B